MTPEIALLEILSELVVKDILTWDAVEGKMKSKGIDVPSTFEPIELCSMSKRDISNAHKNMNVARDNLLEHLGGPHSVRIG